MAFKTTISVAVSPVDLLDGCPQDVKKRYRRLAENALGSYRLAVKLKCIECSGWEYSQAKDCGVYKCPLFVMARRVFG